MAPELSSRLLNPKLEVYTGSKYAPESAGELETQDLSVEYFEGSTINQQIWYIFC